GRDRSKDLKSQRKKPLSVMLQAQAMVSVLISRNLPVICKALPEIPVHRNVRAVFVSVCNLRVRKLSIIPWLQRIGEIPGCNWVIRKLMLLLTGRKKVIPIFLTVL